MPTAPWVLPLEQRPRRLATRLSVLPPTQALETTRLCSVAHLTGSRTAFTTMRLLWVLHQMVVEAVGPKNSRRLAKGLNACWDSPRLTPRL